MLSVTKPAGFASEDLVVYIAEPVTVIVFIKCCLNAFIYLAVTVIVNPITNFRCAGIDCVIIIITIAAWTYITNGLIATFKMFLHQYHNHRHLYQNNKSPSHRQAVLKIASLAA